MLAGLLSAGPGRVATRRDRQEPVRFPGNVERALIRQTAQGRDTAKSPRRIRRSQNGDGLFTLAVECLKEREHDLAEEALSKAIRLNPADAEAQAKKAHGGEGQARQVSACPGGLRRGDPSRPGRHDRLLRRGAAHVGLRQYEKGIEDLDRFLAENCSTAEARYLRRLGGEQTGKLETGDLRPFRGDRLRFFSGRGVFRGLKLNAGWGTSTKPTPIWKRRSNSILTWTVRCSPSPRSAVALPRLE